MINSLKPVILSGGNGSRLWPLSRSLFPKQFLTLYGESTMFQNTLQRISGANPAKPLVICNEDHRFIVAEQCRDMGQEVDSIILEPEGRNTAPAIALAALKSLSEGKDPVLAVLPADHFMADVPAFVDVVKRGFELAQGNKLVTFGIVPTGPETGYGYIRRGKSIGNQEEYLVDSFVEKPDAKTAGEYIATKEYYWNSGMFMFKASVYMQELEKFRPDIVIACKQAMDTCSVDSDFTRVGAEQFALCPEDSIDFAVMEKTESSVVLPLDAGWTDLGAWLALDDISEKDANNNSLKGDVLTHETKNCFIRSEGRMVATVGVDNLVIVETSDAILVANKDSVQDVKKIVEQIKSASRTEHQAHRQVYRPWGNYESIDASSRYQVKRICVKPGGKLSLQMHHHRAEHWVVVSGTALVEVDGKEIMLSENESAYIPIGAKHRLMNPGKLSLELIEVQSGSYLGEDDIVRFEDVYGRTTSL
jgi:mannose-1-phosphate guanylyltransferase/mannose-6-phosphate isomerase